MLVETVRIRPRAASWGQGKTLKWPRFIGLEERKWHGQVSVRFPPPLACAEIAQRYINQQGGGERSESA